MTTPPAGPENDYAHVFHAGNVGDVLKHIVLAALLEQFGRDERITYVDTHSGEGLHQLRTTGEWTEGVYRIWRDPVQGPGVDAWLRIVQSLSRRPDRPETYPGSPGLAARLLGPSARLELFELADEPATGLRKHLGHDGRVSVHQEDGFAGLRQLVERSTPAEPLVVLCDPPYVSRDDWGNAVRSLVDTHRVRPDAVQLLWYPIKSWSRPHVLQRAVREAGLPGASIDLITTPLEHKRNRLNGSGLVCINLPDALLDALAPVLHAVGRRCAIQQGRWSLHVESWRSPVQPPAHREP